MRDSQSGVVRDFVAVGDVSVKVIGADGPVLDAAVPVRQLLEQLVAKTGLPPFLLGLSWSSTERMSAQQADLLDKQPGAAPRRRAGAAAHLHAAAAPARLRLCAGDRLGRHQPAGPRRGGAGRPVPRPDGTWRKGT